MPGTMSLADLVTDHKAGLLDSASAFSEANDAAFKRHLTKSAQALETWRPLTLVGEIALTAGVAEYAAPVGMARFNCSLWGDGHGIKPWDPLYPGRLPAVREVVTAAGRSISLSPAPTALQISMLGSAFRFYYVKAHVLDAAEANTTVAAADRSLLLLHAAAEAMGELAMRGVTRPMTTRDAMSGGPANGSPSALYERFMREFYLRARGSHAA